MRLNGIALVRNVLVAHPHPNLSQQWAGYGYFPSPLAHRTTGSPYLQPGELSPLLPLRGRPLKQQPRPTDH